MSTESTGSAVSLMSLMRRLRATSLTRGRVVAVVLLLALLHGVLSIWSARRESATYDEIAHVGAGYSHLVLADWRSDVGQAPLTKLLSAVAIRSLDPPVPTDSANWRDCNFWGFGYDFLYAHGQGHAILFLARLPSVVIGMLLVLLCFGWAREAWGTKAGLVAAFLAALNPEFLAHSHYATSDLAIATVSTLYLWGFWRFVRRPSLFHGAWCALAFGVAAVTKFSFPMLVPASLALAAMALAEREREPGGESAWGALFVRLLALCVAGLAATVFAAWAACGFQAQMASSPDLGPPLTVERMLPEATFTRSALIAVRDHRLLPEAYVTGVAYMLYTPGEKRRTFLLGRSREGGTPWYFPVALALKTPLPLLVLAVLGLAVRRRATQHEPPLARAALIAPIVVILGMAVGFGYDIGYRHLMPMIPLLVIAASRSTLVLLADRVRRAFLVALLAWQAAGTAWVAPHFLSYFNELAGGPTGGNRWLADSNCDWGQDLDELGRWCRKEGIQRVKLSYFGNASLEEAGVVADGLPSVTSTWVPPAWASGVTSGDVVAVSVTNLRGVYFEDPAGFPMQVELPGTQGTMGFPVLMKYLENRYRPAGRAGYSIVIYRLEPRYER